jgi:DNA-directed RNA polymerase subunit RPC12/RpoP
MAIRKAQRINMSQEIATTTKQETYYKCAHCGDEIFGIPIRKN